MAVVVPSMQAAAFSKYGHQYQSSNPSRALNANARPCLVQMSAGVRSSPTSNLLQYNHVRSLSSLRGDTRLLSRPHYGVPAMSKHSKEFRLQVRSEKSLSRIKDKVKNYLHISSNDSSSSGIDSSSSADLDDDLRRLERRFDIAKHAFKEGLENSFPIYMDAVLKLPKRYLMRKIRRMQERKETDAILGYVIKSGVMVIGVVLTKMREVVLDITKHIPEVQIVDLLKIDNASLMPSRPELGPGSETEHAQPRTMSALPDQAHLVHKEQLKPGTRLIHRENGQFSEGVWDGDVVIRNVARSCSCSDCTAAVVFNREYAPRFSEGDHLYAECEANELTKEPMFHQGIYDGAGHVYHFATSHREVDRAYEKCAECRARGEQRRENLARRNLGPSGIRKSCLYCFAEKACMDKAFAEKGCGDNIESYICRIDYGESVKSWKKGSTVVPLSPIVCMPARRPVDQVVEDARRFYEDDSFGQYSESQKGISHNCESFAYLCKTGLYDSHQVTEHLFQRLVFDQDMSENERFLFLLGSKAFLFVRGMQKVTIARNKADKANRRSPTLVPSKALVPHELWVELDAILGADG